MGRLDGITTYVKMAAAKNRRKCLFILLLCFVYEMYLCDSVQAVASDGESGIVERVTRRQYGDVYSFNNSTSSMRCDNESTYLISEDQCVNDRELFRGTLINYNSYPNHYYITIIQDAMLLFQLVLYV